jgi:hypothetical protein
MFQHYLLLQHPPISHPAQKSMVIYQSFPQYTTNFRFGEGISFIKLADFPRAK